MATIGYAQFAAVYALSKEVREGQLTETGAVKRLVEEYGMNQSSAAGYVRKLDQLLGGRRYTRTMNRPATQFYLENIQSDFGIDAVLKALQSIRSHLSYYPGGAQPGVRAIVDQFEKELGQQAESTREKFDEDVEALIRDPKRAKLELSKAGSDKPKRIATSTTIFARSAAVAALARIRAEGVCERCKKPAPFVKKSSGLPFLEVHHIEQLAHGGPDTLENTLAVCPNCHRELHYG